MDDIDLALCIVVACGIIFIVCGYLNTAAWHRKAKERQFLYGGWPISLSAVRRRPRVTDVTMRAIHQ